MPVAQPCDRRFAIDELSEKLVREISESCDERLLVRECSRFAARERIEAHVFVRCRIAFHTPASRVPIREIGEPERPRPRNACAASDWGIRLPSLQSA